MSCRTPRNDAGLLPKPVEIPKLIPVYIPPDSTWLKAWLECDSNNQVILKAFSEMKSGNVNSSLKLDSGVLDYKAKVIHDTIFIRGKDSLIYVPVPGEKVIVNKLTWWQELWIKTGKIAVFAGLLCLLPPLIKLILKRFKP